VNFVTNEVGFMHLGVKFILDPVFQKIELYCCSKWGSSVGTISGEFITAVVKQTKRYTGHPLTSQSRVFVKCGQRVKVILVLGPLLPV
jgi:hypothetical protein